VVTGDSKGESTSAGETHEDRETMEILQGIRIGNHMATSEIRGKFHTRLSKSE
jgi:hypothetical protein